MTKCHTCNKHYHYLGIAKHRAMHRKKMEDCVITYTNGDTFNHLFSKKEVTGGV